MLLQEKDPSIIVFIPSGLIQFDSILSYSLKEYGNGSVKYNIPEYSLESFTAEDGKLYKKPVMMNAGQVSDEGQPDLPSSSTFIAINPQKTYSINVNIISSNVTENIEILPKNSWDNNSEITFEFSALSAFGRLRVIFATFSVRSIIRFWYDMLVTPIISVIE